VPIAIKRILETISNNKSNFTSIDFIIYYFTIVVRINTIVIGLYICKEDLSRLNTLV